VEFNQLAKRAAAKHGVGMVPFYNLTAARHDMHRRHFCSYSNQVKVGRCCDCTHFCYTPLFWDVFFGQLGRSIRTHSRWDGSRLVEQQEVVAEGSRHGRKWRRGRGKWHGHGHGPRRRAAHGQPEARR
jgi:hypothetical protein